MGKSLVSCFFETQCTVLTLTDKLPFLVAIGNVPFVSLSEGHAVMSKK